MKICSFLYFSIILSVSKVQFNKKQFLICGNYINIAEPVIIKFIIKRIIANLRNSKYIVIVGFTHEKFLTDLFIWNFCFISFYKQHGQCLTASPIFNIPN